MKSVLHVALIAPNGYSAMPFTDAFINNGFNAVHTFDYQLETFEFGHESMRIRLINLAQKIKPDMIFLHVQNSETLDLDTMIKLSSIGFTVLYTYDCRTKEKTEWMYQYAKHIGLVCYSNKEDVQESIERWDNNTTVIQSSCDMDLYVKTENKFKRGIVFVGGNYVGTNLNFPLADERAAMVEHLSVRYGHKFRSLGMGWKYGRLVRGTEEVVTYNGCEIAISHNMFDRELYTSDRLWRIMASGAFCLTKYFKGLETIFDRGIHLDWWHNFDELDEKIDYYLANPEDRVQIAMTGMIRVREHHTWSHRIADIMDTIRKVKPEEPPCKDTHRVKGELPLEERHDNTVCDCGKFKHKWEECGCGNKVWQIRAYENN